MAHSTPPKSISLKQTVEGESIRLQRRFNEDHYLVASGGLWLLSELGEKAAVLENTVLKSGLCSNSKKLCYIADCKWMSPGSL